MKQQSIHEVEHMLSQYQIISQIHGLQYGKVVKDYLKGLSSIGEEADEMELSIAHPLCKLKSIR